MRRTILALAVVIAAALSLSTTAAAAPPPNVKFVTKTAPIITDPESGFTSVEITLNIKCYPVSGEARVEVIVEQGQDAGAAGDAPVTCTGRWETVVILAKGPYNWIGPLTPGPATAGALLMTIDTMAGDSRNIELV
jgi:hypothetical protein